MVRFRQCHRIGSIHGRNVHIVNVRRGNFNRHRQIRRPDHISRHIRPERHVERIHNRLANFRRIARKINRQIDRLRGTRNNRNVCRYRPSNFRLDIRLNFSNIGRIKRYIITMIIRQHTRHGSRRRIVFFRDTSRHARKTFRPRLIIGITPAMRLISSIVQKSSSIFFNGLAPLIDIAIDSHIDDKTAIKTFRINYDFFAKTFRNSIPERKLCTSRTITISARRKSNNANGRSIRSLGDSRIGNNFEFDIVIGNKHRPLGKHGRSRRRLDNNPTFRKAFWLIRQIKIDSKVFQRFNITRREKHILPHFLEKKNHQKSNAGKNPGKYLQHALAQDRRLAVKRRRQAVFAYTDKIVQCRCFKSHQATSLHKNSYLYFFSSPPLVIAISIANALFVLAASTRTDFATPSSTSHLKESSAYCFARRIIFGSSFFLKIV